MATGSFNEQLVLMDSQRRDLEPRLSSALNGFVHGGNRVPEGLLQPTSVNTPTVSPGGAKQETERNGGKKLGKRKPSYHRLRSKQSVANLDGETKLSNPKVRKKAEISNDNKLNPVNNEDNTLNNVNKDVPKKAKRRNRKKKVKDESSLTDTEAEARVMGESDKENNRIDSRSSSVSLIEVDIDDSNLSFEEPSLGAMVQEEKNSTAAFLPPNLFNSSAVNRKKSVSELIQQHEGRSLNSTKSVPDIGKSSELIGRWKRTASVPEETKSNPFDITLRATKMQNSNGRITSESLTKIQPIKTIIGVSHQQILDLELSDVKVKTILSSSKVSKFAQNALAFVVKHTDDLFQDEEKKTVFFKLCIGVALYESIGFRKSTRAHPQILEWFGGYEEITLEKTRTKLTPSNKDIHQNDFDYSVLSYFGHILIWALFHQRTGGAGLWINKYDIELSQSTIRSSIGGFHLWDRLIRESKGMNSKRWKHVIKFRNSFAFEEDQFMLMLRFMRVDKVIP